MPRANRYRIGDQVWHITERCHQKQPLLDFLCKARSPVTLLETTREGLP